jgi:hypothetical protein
MVKQPHSSHKVGFGGLMYVIKFSYQFDETKMPYYNDIRNACTENIAFKCIKLK